MDLTALSVCASSYSLGHTHGNRPYSVRVSPGARHVTRIMNIHYVHLLSQWLR